MALHYRPRRDVCGDGARCLCAADRPRALAWHSVTGANLHERRRYLDAGVVCLLLRGFRAAGVDAPPTARFYQQPRIGISTAVVSAWARCRGTDRTGRPGRLGTCCCLGYPSRCTADLAVPLYYDCVRCCQRVPLHGKFRHFQQAGCL